MCCIAPMNVNIDEFIDVMLADNMFCLDCYKLYPHDLHDCPVCGALLVTALSQLNTEAGNALWQAYSWNKDKLVAMRAV